MPTVRSIGIKISRIIHSIEFKYLIIQYNITTKKNRTTRIDINRGALKILKLKMQRRLLPLHTHTTIRVLCSNGRLLQAL